MTSFCKPAVCHCYFYRHFRLQTYSSAQNTAIAKYSRIKPTPVFVCLPYESICTNIASNNKSKCSQKRWYFERRTNNQQHYRPSLHDACLPKPTANAKGWAREHTLFDQSQTTPLRRLDNACLQCGGCIHISHSVRPHFGA